MALGGALMADGAIKFSSGHGAKDAVLMLMMQDEDTIWIKLGEPCERLSADMVMISI